MNTFLGILTLGFIILIHEWGHYIAARLCKVRVDVFSIGFGPRLFGVKRGDTDWRLSAVPLGGYVRMAGQDITDIDSSTESKPTGAPDELLSKTRWQRAFISFAGPAVNLIFPLLLLGLYYSISGMPADSFLSQPIVVAGTPAAQQDDPHALHNGDHIVSINGTKSPTWEKAQVALSHATPGSKVNIAVSNNGATREFSLQLPTAPTGHLLGYAPIPASVGEVALGTPADNAGLREGDVVRAVDGQPVQYWDQFVELVRSSGGKTLQLAVDRKGQPVTISVTPKQGIADGSEKNYQIGIQRAFSLTYTKVSPVEAFKSGAMETGSLVVQTVDVVGKLLSGRVSVKQLQSVVGISRSAGQAVSHGLFFIISFMALISVNLGILNLLPIPILDGGHILLLTLEGIRRRDFSLAFKERFIQVGLVFLLALIAYVMYNDVGRILHIHS
jgi:regulator of sigma E protease